MDPQLKERIKRLSNEELLEMLERKAADHRKEALDYAAEELETRGISFSLGANVVIDETAQHSTVNATNVDTTTPHSEEQILDANKRIKKPTCPNCGDILVNSPNLKNCL